MDEDQIHITLIGRALSKKGTEFVYNGALPECEGCRMYKVCNNLIPKRRYRVTGLRSENVHSCSVHYEGVCAVEVVEAPITALIDAKKAILNSEITIDPLCTETECENYELCSGEGLIEGERYLILSVSDYSGPECLKKRALKKVELKPCL